MLEVYSGFNESLLEPDFIQKTAKNYRNCTEYFFCAFKMQGGDIVLDDSNAVFRRLIGNRKKIKESRAENILSPRSYRYLLSLFNNYRDNNKLCRFLMEGRNETVYIVECLFIGGTACFTGKAIKDYKLFLHENKDIFRGKSSPLYIGTVSAVSKNGGYEIRSCSENITEMLPPCREGRNISEAFKSWNCDKWICGILSECIAENTPLSFFGFTAENFTPVRISAKPIISKINNEIVLSFEEAFQTRGTISDYAFCEVGKTNQGSFFIADINETMSELLKNNKISFSRICGKDAADTAKEKAGAVTKIRSSDGGYFCAKYFPRYDENSLSGYYVMINLVPKAAEFKKLSSREKRALTLAADGNPNKYIAHVMNISEGTVKKMLHDGYSKLGISSRVELVKLYSENLLGKK